MPSTAQQPFDRYSLKLAPQVLEHGDLYIANRCKINMPALSRHYQRLTPSIKYQAGDTRSRPRPDGDQHAPRLRLTASNLHCVFRLLGVEGIAPPPQSH